MVGLLVPKSAAISKPGVDGDCFSKAVDLGKQHGTSLSGIPGSYVGLDRFGDSQIRGERRAMMVLTVVANDRRSVRTSEALE